ncbi:hypothetical protein Tco_1143154 [Tanacetum coccineum]
MVWSGYVVLMSGKTDSIKLNNIPGCLPGSTFVYSEVFKLDFSSSSHSMHLHLLVRYLSEPHTIQGLGWPLRKLSFIVEMLAISPVASASTGAEGLIPPKTAKQKLARKNELKAKSTLMLTILDEHLLKFHACKGCKEDANLKLLRSLPSAWNNIALIMRNKYDLDTLSMDDLYNNLKVYESEIKGKSSVSAASSKDQASTASYVDDVMFPFFSNQSNAPQLDYEDLEQIDADDLEKMDLKWQVAMLTMRVKRAPRNQGNRNRDAPRRNAPVDTSTTNALVVQDGIDEAVYEEDIAFLKYDVQMKDISIKDLKNQLEEALKEKDHLKLKLEKFEESSKNLAKLIDSQISAKDKTGLGYDSQINESEVVC